MNLFFKSTPLHKEWSILTLLSKEKNLSQRKIANELGLSVAMVNSYLEEYHSNGLINMENLSPKVVIYSLTDKGEERRRFLNIQYLVSVLSVYNEAKEECYIIFKKVINKGYKNILLYGAGEVAEILLSVLNDVKEKQFRIVGIIDDDNNKIGKFLLKKPIIKIDDINNYDYDAIMISSYSNNDIIYNKLIEKGFDKNKIIQFFDDKYKY